MSSPGAGGDVRWAVDDFGDPALQEWMVAGLWEAGTHLMGRGAYDDMAPYWPSSTDIYAPPMNEIPKVDVRTGVAARHPRPGSGRTTLRAVTGLPITGRCLCGAVRFEILAEPLSAGYCHCTRCQRRTGAAASAQARMPKDALRVIAGEEHVRTWQPDGGFAKLFCGTCGSALFSHDPAKEHWAVRLGALDPGHGIRPAFRQRVESACEWEPLPDDGLPRFEGRAPAND